MNDTALCKDMSVSLCLTQQFDSFLRVGYGEDGGALDRLERDLHRVTVVTLQRQHIAGDEVVLDNQKHQRLLIVGAISNGAADLLAL